MRLKRAWMVGAATAVAAVAAAAVGVPALAATSNNGVHLSAVEHVAPGVDYSTFDTDTSHGSAHGYLLKIDLSQKGVKVGALYPGHVGATGVITSQADRVGAVAGINADFFNIGETGATVGPMVIDGTDYKAGVPGAQRFGPSLPPGDTNDTVFGITADGTPAISDLKLDGTATGPDGAITLSGLNQYAITVGGVGVFTSQWGDATRKRATCGTDDDRNGPCADKTKEVTVTDGKVSAVSDTPGSGAIAKNQQVLVARDDGVKQLDGLAKGDSVKVDYKLASPDGVKFANAVGAMPIVKDAKPLQLDDSAIAPRTAAGDSANGKTFYMVAVDGRNASSVGASLKSLAAIMTKLGADDAVNFDGGGSTTLVARKAGNTATSVRNHPSDGSQRSVGNGLGVFSS
ncbi:MAG TPA: phosphodiester glycosidase family protein [Stackebrandtia sp.]|jgi:exopolysaccharide biosynthesis protein|uniref:phosphodiester glycosidase family protein n=1 Tax=Stackebrandtia sp. TaxID=2023065 RepID=UPI002D5009A3|nr:phosphodiester glycosidase family protein [Stackebrandtia sp.]HZE40809.1 phosphodiester glycosidase family protein [Stackebrandtia sp.]